MQRVTHKMCVEKHKLIDSGVDLIAFFASSKLVFLFCYRNSSKDQVCFLTNKHSKMLALLSEIKRLTCICTVLTRNYAPPPPFCQLGLAKSMGGGAYN